MSDSILTVVSAAATYDLTTLETVKDELGITTTGSDQTLRRYIADASARIAAYCNRVFAFETVSELFTPDRAIASGWGAARGESWDSAWEARMLWRARSILPLSRFPVVTIVSVVEDTSGVVLDPSYYEVDAATGFLYRMNQGARTKWTANRTTVTYSGGYVLVSGLPRPLEQAAIDLVKARWFARGRDPRLKVADVPNVLRQEFWVGSVGAGDMPDEIAALLAPYRGNIVA